MKVLFGILFLLFSSVTECHSQVTSNDTVRLTKIPPEGVLLDRGWKFRSGDDSSWAKPDFDDNTWELVNPAQDILHVHQLQKANIGWFRLKLQVDSALFDQPLGILLSQTGASEIYLDGKLLYKFGEVSTQKNKEKNYRLVERTFSIKLNAKKIQTLAVRYSFLNNGFLVKSTEFQNYCLRIMINNAGVTYAPFQIQSQPKLIYELCQICFWLALGLISGSLFYSYRSQIIYRDVCFFSIAQVLGGILGGLIADGVANPNLSSFIFWISRGFGCICLIYALYAICVLFHQKKGWYYYALLSTVILVFISFPILYEAAASLVLLALFLFSLEYTRRTWRAFREGYPGAIVLFSAQIFFFICVIINIILVKEGKDEVAKFIIFLGVVNIPIGWSLFMAGEYARTGLALQARINEVELLSQRAIAQEQEKQQLLANQNETLEARVVERTSQLNQSLKDLQSTQAQLIQSEKMASLGELTAGIAHEIQNPLNFINNFSEVNKELLFEIKEEIDKEKFNEVKTIANDVIENEEKINQHGKRVDAIVKSMLQHSRSSTGPKEPTDINVLADEYLRLAYHGIRAKEKSFNAKMETDYDGSIGKVNVIPQDIGRVLLNLYNNAFYVLAEKKKQLPVGYEPVVSVSTKKVNGKLEISVWDNGKGISQMDLVKIFQPFFTTKPTGQGTGLGLSLSYDIVKAHGGEIKISTLEGEFTEFVIQLPISVV